MSPAKREQTFALLRHALGAVSIGILAGFLGPFGTTQALTTIERYGFWVGLILLGYAESPSLGSDIAAAPRLAALASPAQAALIALLSAVPMTFATAWALTQVQPERIVDAARLPALFLAVASVRAGADDRTIRHAPGGHGHLRADDAEAPALHAAHSPPSRTQRLIAIEGHDHYLRVHTALGSDLILCRLADALNELVDADGMQVHRSWWVATKAVVGLDREAGRTLVLLDNGLRVPVSRSHLAAVRSRGWRLATRRPALATA